MSLETKALLEQAKTFIRENDSQLYGILVAVVIVLFTLVLFALWRRRKSAKQGVLITGLCDAGKTLIFTHLLHNKYVQTHTSIKENIGDYIIKNSSLRLIDIPGHERLRGRFFENYKSLSRGVVFVIDSLTIQKEIRDAAEFLYMLLTDPVLVKTKTQFLILCNKQDQTMAKGSTVIKTLLEKELNVLRVTKTHQLTSIEGSSNNTFLGTSGKEFDFSQSTLSVSFAESSAVKNDQTEKPDLDSLVKWLANIV